MTSEEIRWVADRVREHARLALRSQKFTHEDVANFVYDTTIESLVIATGVTNSMPAPTLRQDLWQDSARQSQALTSDVAKG